MCLKFFVCMCKKKKVMCDIIYDKFKYFMFYQYINTLIIVGN